MLKESHLVVMALSCHGTNVCNTFKGTCGDGD